MSVRRAVIVGDRRDRQMVQQPADRQVANIADRVERVPECRKPVRAQQWLNPACWSVSTTASTLDASSAASSRPTVPDSTAGRSAARTTTTSMSAESRPIPADSAANGPDPAGDSCVHRTAVLVGRTGPTATICAESEHAASAVSSDPAAHHQGRLVDAAEPASSSTREHDGRPRARCARCP